MINLSGIAPGTFMGKLARLPLRMIPKSATVSILQGPLRGSKWIVGSQRNAFWLGSYEPAMQEAMVRRVTPGSTFYDVGANVGFYSLLASQLVRDGRVYAFEPLPINVSYLRRHLELNQITNVQVVEGAISNHSGVAHFEVEETGAMGRLEDAGTLSVTTISLDSFIDSADVVPPDFIKMDIEGEELNALKGAEHCLRAYRPTIFLATHGKQIALDCCALLSTWNYQLLPIERSEEDRAEILAVPKL
jgi:FkbM family methyltransferase